jgi:hypothetical protein
VGRRLRGLRHLAERIGEDLVVGAVLYTDRETVPFEPRFRAIPISAVWEARESLERLRVRPPEKVVDNNTDRH